VRAQLWGLLAAAALTAGGCAGSSTVAPTTPAPVNVTGTWSGDVSVMDTTARMTWTLTQSGTTVTGPVLVGLSNGVVLLNGFLTGTMANSALTYTISVGPDGVPTQPTCAGQLGGTMTANIALVSTLSGSTAVISSNCTAPFPGGPLTLTRQ
jgi:hypothetical protein